MKSTTPGLWNDGFGQIGQTLKVLEDLGVHSGHLAKLRSDKRYARRIAHYMRFGWVDQPRHHFQMRNAMDGALNYFGPLDWMEFYGAILDENIFINIPWSVETLNEPCPFTEDEKVHQTHFLFFTMGCLPGTHLDIDEFTFQGWSRLYRNDGRCIETKDGHPKTWFPGQSQKNPHNRSGSLLGWHLVCMRPQRSEGYANFTAREMSLPKDYEVASAVDVVAMLALNHKLADNRIDYQCTDFTALLGQCCDRHDDGERSDIRVDEKKGIRVGKHSEVSDLGVFVSKKLPTA